MADHTFRFGVTHGMVGKGDAWAAAARRAEDLGYATLLLPDTMRTSAPLVALAGAATVTSTLHVGTWVLCDPMRNPRQLVWEATTLQSLAGGRFELGIGAGRPDAAADCAELGVPFGPAGQRITRLRETLALARARLPETPIMIAASGPKLLAMAAQLADTIALGWPPHTDTALARERVEIVRDAAEDRDPELATGLIAVGTGPQPWLERMGMQASDLAAADAVTVVTGTPEEMADELQRRRDALGLSYFTVPANAAELFAPVVERLAGR